MIFNCFVDNINDSFNINSNHACRRNDHVILIDWALTPTMSSQYLMEMNSCRIIPKESDSLLGWSRIFTGYRGSLRLLFNAVEDRCLHFEGRILFWNSRRIICMSHNESVNKTWQCINIYIFNRKQSVGFIMNYLSSNWSQLHRRVIQRRGWSLTVIELSPRRITVSRVVLDQF